MKPLFAFDKFLFTPAPLLGDNLKLISSFTENIIWGNTRLKIRPTETMLRIVLRAALGQEHENNR